MPVASCRTARDLADSYRRVAYLRRQNPEGSQARRSPSGATDKFEFVINLKTAKQIGLTIPPKVLAPGE